jgi:hypothetical protein
MATATVSPADGVVCATIEQRALHDGYGRDGDEHYAFFSSLRFLYGSSQQASAHLRSLVRAGLVRSRKLPRDYGTGYALTVEGYAAAWASLPACAKCLAPIDRGAEDSAFPHLCRACVIDIFRGHSEREEEMAESSRRAVDDHLDRMEAYLALIEDMVRPDAP